MIAPEMVSETGVGGNIILKWILIKYNMDWINMAHQ